MENLSAVARLRLLLEGLEQVKEGSKDIYDFGESLEKMFREEQRAEKATKSLGKEIDKTGEKAKAAGKDVKTGTSDWDKYTSAIDQAQKAQRAFAQSQVASQFGSSAIPALPASQMTSAQRKALLAAYDASNTSVIAEARKLEAATDNMANHAARARYALYDVSTTAAITAASIAAVGTAAVVAFGTVESSFTNVERTLGNVDTSVVESLREDLMALTREIPLSFSEISQIATLGNQLGVSADKITGFTEVVAKFSTATGMSVEQSAQAFGSLGDLLNLSVDQYEALGSSISFAGRMTRATESEIVSMTQRLAASATRAGFTAEQVVGLSTALASLRVAPERAQGVMEVYFSRLNTALADGGEQLQAFAHYAGVSQEEVARLVTTDPVAFFERLAQGISTLDSVSQTQALQQLGLDGIRAGEVFGRVAGNLDTFRQSLAFATQGFREGTDLADQYAKKLDDLASKWQIFLNAVMEAGAAVGEALAPALAEAMEFLGNLLVAFAEWATSPAGRTIVTITASIGAMVAALTGLITILALASASFLAINTAITDLGIRSALASGGIRGLAGAMLGLGSSATGAAIGMRILRAAMITTGIGALAVGLGTLVALLVDYRNTVVSLGEPVHFLIDSFINMAQGVAVAGQAVGQFLSGIPGVGKAFGDLANTMSGVLYGLPLLRKQAHDTLTGWAKDAQGADGSTTGLGDAYADLVNSMDDLDPGPLEDLGDEAEKAKVEVRTLVDYANDLQSVFSRSFDIRFGATKGLDAISSAWNSIAEENQDARDAIEKYRDGIQEAEDAVDKLQQKIRSLSADRNTKTYWLSIAEMYGDDLRAAQLREEIADINLDIADSQKSITEEQKKGSDASAALIAEQDKLNRGLTGNTQAAIQNRAALLGLVGGYQEYLSALAASGASTEVLQAEAARLKQEFIDQAVQMGFSRDEVYLYSAAFDDMSLAIANVPKDVTVDAHTNPAMQALAELQARLAAQAANKYSAGTIYPTFDYSAWAQAGNYAGTVAGESAKNALAAVLLEQSSHKGARPVGSQRTYYSDLLKALGYANGGYTGAGGKYDFAGFVHKGEFVFPQSDVNQSTGMPKADSMARLLNLGGGGNSSSASAFYGGITDEQIDKLARATAYYQKNLVMLPETIQRGNQMANAASNRSGRT